MIGSDAAHDEGWSGRSRAVHQPTTAITDEELILRQDVLRAGAADVLVDLDLFERLGTVGRPVQTGSLALGLMVWRDIDVTVLCPTLAVAPIFEALRPLALHPRVRRLVFRNDTGHWNTDPDYPDGLYWGVDCRSQAGDDWKLDVWFLREGTTQFDLQHIDSLPPRLTSESRLAILRIKDAWHRRPEYGSDVRSYDIYEAVLDYGARTPAEFEAYLRERVREA
jgi:hypothetical protein